MIKIEIGDMRCPQFLITITGNIWDSFQDLILKIVPQFPNLRIKFIQPHAGKFTRLSKSHY